MTTTDQREPFCALFSYWYYRSDAAFGKVTAALHRARDRGQPVRVLVDSGAFSADTQGHRISVEDYASWLRSTVLPEWGPWLVGSLNLDVLRDADGSWRNWRRLQQLGCDTVPVTHLGDSTDVLDRYVETGADYIGLGAMVGKSMTRKLRWAAHVHKHALSRHPEVRLHGLGVSSQAMVERLPWWSVDSSSFAASARFARLTLFDPDTKQVFTVHLTRSVDIYRSRKTLDHHYDVDFDSSEWSNLNDRRRLMMVGGQAIALWQRSVRRRRMVSPPLSLRTMGTGTFIYSVDGQNSVDFPARLEGVARL